MEQINLRDFIQKTLVDIARAIRGANEDMKSIEKIDSNLFILSHSISGDKSRDKGIEFDIAIAATKSEKESAGFKISIVEIGGGISGGKKIESEMLHRIRFEVGIIDHWG